MISAALPSARRARTTVRGRSSMPRIDSPRGGAGQVAGQAPCRAAAFRGAAAPPPAGPVRTQIQQRRRPCSSPRSRIGAIGRIARRACRARSRRQSGRRCDTARARHASSSAGSAAASLQRLAQRHRAQRALRDGLEQARQHLQHHRRAAGGCGAAWPSCSSRISPARRLRVRRASTRAASPLTVSKPRRVQLASCNPSRCSTGSSSGLRSPAGARKKRGADAADAASSICCARCDLAAQRGADRAARNRVDADSCGSRSHGRCATQSRTQLRRNARHARRCRRTSTRARCSARIASTRGVTSGSGPSSIVIATSPRAAAAAGRRVQLEPRRAAARPQARAR